MQDISSITNAFDPRLAALLGWCVIAAKVGVDWIKTATTLPKWGPPSICFGAMVVLILLLMLALAIPITPQLAAQAIIMAIIGTVMAIGSTALQARTTLSTDTTTAMAIVDEIEGRMRATPVLSENTRRAVREAFPHEEPSARNQAV